MASDPVILAFDTSAAHCAAALLSGDRIIASHGEDMGRGQAERLVPLLEEILQGQNLEWSGLDAIGVGVGPGNFTGIRISVSLARGLALGLEIPVYGIDGFQARKEATGATGTVAIPGPRGQVYVWAEGRSPELTDGAQARDDLGRFSPEPVPCELAAAIARVAARRWPEPAPPPAPLYLRAPNAAPSRDAPPVLLD